jgi:hypothetical protein
MIYDFRVRFPIWQGSSEGALGRIIHRTLWRDHGAAIADVEGSINELVMLLCCEVEKGGFAGWTEGRHQFYYYGFISLHNIHYQTK